jgi:hypothetical protein
MPTQLFKAGDSANPAKKRAKESFAHATDVIWLARRYTKSAVKVMVAIMKNPKAGYNNRLRAAEALLNRGWGSYEKGLDPLSGMTPLQIKETAARLKALHSRPSSTKITIHSDKTVVTGGQGVLTNGEEKAEVLQDSTGYAVEFSGSGEGSEAVQQNDGEERPNGKENSDD